MGICYLQFLSERQIVSLQLETITLAEKQKLDFYLFIFINFLTHNVFVEQSGSIPLCLLLK